jgi:murein DD-endopeptidase MepM/ murein hydrolase activator NlpD
MLDEVISDVRTHILRHFPERQIYLRSGGEVKYYVLTTKLQLAVTTLFSLMAVWCLWTLISVLIGNNPLQSSSKKMQQEKANFERIFADLKAKEQNAQLMLTEQRKSFETIARQLEQKHQTLSQIMGSQTQGVAGPAGPAIEYSTDRVLMSPITRDTAPRESRSNTIRTASLATGLNFDNSLNAAERETLEKIEHNRALIKATEIDIETVLQAASNGKGGAYRTEKDVDLVEGGFVSRVAAIQARAAEVEALDDAIRALPVGHPVGAETYRTSGFGLRSDPFTKRPTMHHGLDFGGRQKTPILATADGVVSYVGRKGNYGRVVEIDHGHGFKTRYAHLHKTHVKRGQKVEKGFKIGGMGSTGRSTANHLHYEVHFQGRTYDPSKFLKAGLYVQ